MKRHSFQSHQARRLLSSWLIPGVCMTVLIHSAVPQSVIAQPSALNSRCQTSLLNAHCQAPQVAQQTTESAPPPTKPQVIKLKLNDLSGVSEWIRAEVTGNQIKLLHTVVTQSGLSKFITSAAPIRLPIAIGHTWYDHPTSRITFQPDGCEKTTACSAGQPLLHYLLVLICTRGDLLWSTQKVDG